MLYISLFFVGFILARSGAIEPRFMIYFIIALFLFSGLISFMLPQVSSSLFVASVVLGTIVSVGILFGLYQQVK